MKVKQLIYTSWKNGSSTKKGFMVYSKSAGISPEDENAITSAMRYTTLPSLPYTPTVEEIETLFPRNDSYFRLPSGKYCFAQSSYLGKDYSGRTGNYIIHAYISDTQPDFNQFNLIRSDIFKRFMTQEELDAESNPPALPEVEITVPDNPGDIAMLKQFFTPDKKDRLRYLVEAVLQGVSMKKTVYVFDEQPNLACWYKALAYCLPKMTLSQVTYSTYSCYVPNDIAVACVKAGTIFNYDMNLSMGNFVYNFKDNKVNDKITVSSYTDKIVDEFYKDPLNAARFASSLETYMAEAHGDLFLAIQLSQFYSGGYNLFNTPETLGAIFGCITTSGRIPAAQLGDIIGNIIMSSPRFNVTANADVYKYVIAHGSEEMRFAIIKQYSDMHFANSVPVSSFDSEYHAVINGAPFAWNEFLAYINSRVGKDRFINNYGVMSFAAYALVCTVLDYGTPAEVNDKLVPEYTRSIANSSDLSLFKLFLGKLGQKGLARPVITAITANYQIFNNNNYRHTIDLLEAINMPDLTTGTFAFMIRSFSGDGNFTSLCEKYLASNPALYAEMEKLSAGDFAIKAFLENMISVQFLARTPDDAALSEFYNKYYRKSAEMKDVFFKGLKKRISAEPVYVDRAKIAVDWYDRIAAADPSQQAVAMQIARDAIFDKRSYYVDFAKLYNDKPQAIDNFIRVCKGAGVELKDNYYDVIKLAEQIRGVNKKTYKNNNFLEVILKHGLLAGYNGNFVGKTLAENHLEDIFNLYSLVLTCEKKNADAANTDFIANIFAPLIEAVNVSQDEDFCDQFIARIGKLKGDYMMFMIGALEYVVKNTKSGLAFCIDRYFAGMQKKKIQKFYEEIKDEEIKISEDVDKYIDEKINSSQNVGFFAKFFGGKNKK